PPQAPPAVAPPAVQAPPAAPAPPIAAAAAAPPPPQPVPAPSHAPASPPPRPIAAAAGEAAPDRDAVEGWQRVLTALPPKTRAYFREARPRLEGDLLVLSFPYSFHHRQAVEHTAQVEALVRSWLGELAR